MIEMLIRIPGPTFLGYFICLSFVCILLGRLWVNADGSTQYPLPELTRFDPLSVAALRGSWASVIRTAIFSLWNRKLVEIKITKHWWKRDEIKIIRMPKRKEVLSPIEEEIYRLLLTPSEPSDLLQDTGFRERIQGHLEPINRQLKELHLVRSASDRFRAWIATLVMARVIGAVGGTKLYLGITRGRPVLFLIILLIVSLIVLFGVLKPQAIFTKLGRHYLKELQEHFGWVKESLEAGSAPEGIDPTLAIAIFGVGILAGASRYSPFSEAFSSSKYGWGGGCGGGGCGGGGCGGGCGGCGG